MEVYTSRGERLIHALFNLMNSMKMNMTDCCSVFPDLSEKDFAVIGNVGQKQNMNMSEIAECINAPLSTVTSMVDKLVGKKYLDRYHSGDDRRVVLVTLASNGRMMYDTLMSRKQEMADKALSGFNEEEQDKLIDYLEKLPGLLYPEK